MKASEKNNGLNAYVTGLGSTKRYVMWDTTTDRLPDDEILFVFGHESGHYVLHHIIKSIAGISAALFFIYWTCAGFAAWLARRFGRRWGLGEPGDQTPLASRAGFIVLLFTISVASFVLEPVNLQPPLRAPGRCLWSGSHPWPRPRPAEDRRLRLQSPWRVMA